MGCTNARAKVDEDSIEEFERRLQFSRFTISELKLVTIFLSDSHEISSNINLGFLSCLWSIKRFVGPNSKVFDQPQDQIQLRIQGDRL